MRSIFGRLSKSIPGAVNRLGQRNENGLTRFEYTGSVMIFIPSIWIRSVAWPMRVIRKCFPVFVSITGTDFISRCFHFSFLRSRMNRRNPYIYPVRLSSSSSLSVCFLVQPRFMKCLPSKWSLLTHRKRRPAIKKSIQKMIAATVPIPKSMRMMISSNKSIRWIGGIIKKRWK